MLADRTARLQRRDRPDQDQPNTCRGHVRCVPAQLREAIRTSSRPENSTIRSLPGCASAGRHRWKPAKNRGRSSCHQSKGPPSSRRCGSTPAPTNWPEETCRKGSSNAACSSVPVWILRELEAPVEKNDPTLSPSRRDGINGLEDGLQAQNQCSNLPLVAVGEGRESIPARAPICRR
jgi:hypothetical protein